MHELKINILIIDDDILLLRALTRTLNRLCPNTQITCIANAAEFEPLISKGFAPHIIFCDSMMKLPSGQYVLRRAKDISPLALRCLLTGDLSSNYQLQINNAIHFHLIKPFKEIHLISVLESVKLLNELPISTAHKTILGQLKELPFLGETTQNLIRELNKEEPNVNLLEQYIIHDPVLTGKVLQMANSAFMGFDNHTSNLKEAIVRIGLNNLKAIAVFLELSQQLNNKAKTKDISHLINKGYKKGELAQSLAKYLKQDRQTQLFAFAVGLLSVIGELTIVCNEQEIDPKKVPEFSLSAYLLALWGFEKIVVRAQLIDKVPTEKTLSLTVLHIIVEHIVTDEALNYSLEEYDFVDEIGIREDVESWFLANKASN